MQTFLPFPDFAASARCLDNRRLGKQRVETLQILKALTNPSYGWRNHPATRMWDGHVPLLAFYGTTICKEWIKRGFNDTCLEKILAFTSPDLILTTPDWLGSEPFHASHRSNLLRKDPTHYSQFGWTEPDNLSYVWPVA